MVKFSHEYRKLADRLCTTVRRYTPEKSVYYAARVGKIEYPHKKLIQVLTVPFNELSQEFIDYDTEGVYKFDFGPTELVLILFLLEV